MMALRKEIQDFSSSCEKVLSLFMMSGNEPLSDDERQLIVYYADELRRLTASIDAAPRL